MGQKKGLFIILISVLIFVILAGVIFLASRNPARTALPANLSPVATQAQGRSDFCVPVYSLVPTATPISEGAAAPGLRASPFEGLQPKDLDPGAPDEDKASILVLRCDGDLDLIRFDPLRRSPVSFLSADDYIVVYTPPLPLEMDPLASPEGGLELMSPEVSSPTPSPLPGGLETTPSLAAPESTETLPVQPSPTPPVIGYPAGS